jgi:hypothetical protein
MTTPYDTALRVVERKLDAVRAAIGLAIDELERIETAHIAIENAMMREGLVASDEPRLTTDRYFVRARDHRRQLGEHRAAAHLYLESLRRKAVEVYGSRTAIEGAVGAHREAEARSLAAAEQAMLDDLTAARPSARRARAVAGHAATTRTSSPSQISAL